MTYITVDVDTDDVLRELDEYEIREYLIDYGDLIITDTTSILNFLEKKDAYGLMNFIYKTYEQQIGEVHATTN